MKKLFLFAILVNFLLVSCASVLTNVKIEFPDTKSIEFLEGNPDQYIENGPAQYLLTQEEWRIWKKEIKKIKDPELRSLTKRVFIKWFWQRRNPELKKRFVESVIYAEKEFRDERYGSGWYTDRGKILILFGSPDSRNTFTPIMGNYISDTLNIQNDPTTLAEEWIYNDITNLLAESRFELRGLFEVYFRKGTYHGWELAVKVSPTYSYDPTLGDKLRYDIYVPITQLDSYTTYYYTQLLRAEELIRESYIVNRDLKFEDVLNKKE